MNTSQEQLKQYKADLEKIFFSGKFSGEVADLIRSEIIKVGKKIEPEIIDTSKNWLVSN